MWVRFLGREDSLEKEMATHSSVLVSWLENPMDRGACGLQCIGLQRVRHAWSNLAHTLALWNREVAHSPLGAHIIAGSVLRTKGGTLVCLTIFPLTHLTFDLHPLSPVSASNVVDLGLIPGLERSPGGGNGNPLQFSCLENPTDGKAW